MNMCKITLPAVAALGMATALGGCAGPAGLAVSAAVSLASSMIGGAGPGGGGLALDPNQALSRQLGAADHAVRPSCQRHLAEATPAVPGYDGPATGQRRCEMRLVCLGGTSTPMMMRVCEGGSDDTAGVTEAVSTPVAAGAPWRWSTPVEQVQADMPGDGSASEKLVE